MGCDMCGAGEAPFVTSVEGVEMQLCKNCKVYGEVKRTIPSLKEVAQQEKRAARAATSPRGARRQGARAGNVKTADTEVMVVSDFGSRIKQARERMGLKQEQLAKRLAIKESKLHKFETGSFVPVMEMVHKLERALNITLTEQYAEKQQNVGQTDSGPLTIADLIKKKQ